MSKVEFTEEWEDTWVVGGKRLNARLFDTKDKFVGCGKEKGCSMCDSWFRIIAFSCAVLSSENTKRVVEKCDVSPKLYLEEVPKILDNHHTSEYFRTGKPYKVREDGEGVKIDEDVFKKHTCVGNEKQGTFLQRDCPPKEETIQPDYNNRYLDRWVREPGLNSKRFNGSWWDLMCFSVEVLNHEITKEIIDNVPEISFNYDIPENLDYDDRPYYFRK